MARKKLSEKDLEILYDLKEKGKSDKKIAEFLEVSQSTVSKNYNDMKLKKELQKSKKEIEELKANQVVNITNNTVNLQGNNQSPTDIIDVEEIYNSEQSIIYDIKPNNKKLEDSRYGQKFLGK